MKDDGGYAFPRELPDIKLTPDEAYKSIINHSGMTLRDYFAGQAASGMRLLGIGVVSKDDKFRAFNSDEIAEQAYKDADAMIKERNK